MDLIFCTLFDSNYLDKGLVLYDSMYKHMDEFKLYVFAFDDKAYDILKNENLKNMIVVSLKEFETEELLKVKNKRTRAEYCWTCSPWIIKHVIEYYNEPICTYIDADMMFFSSPQCVFDDMKQNDCSVIIVPHRFKNRKEELLAHDKVGSYCVEFNTFVNNSDGMKVLNWWADKCLEWCFYAVPGTTEWYGDQKYLNAFSEMFEGVYICNHYGVGLAPWNTCLIAKGVSHGTMPYIKVLQTGEEVPVILYHFEGVSFLTYSILHTPSGIVDKELHYQIYDTYVENIKKRRKYVEEKYSFKLTRSRRVVTKSWLIGLYQKYISPFRRVKSFMDLYIFD